MTALQSVVSAEDSLSLGSSRVTFMLRLILQLRSLHLTSYL